jgi:hypothetical protein
MNSSYAIKILRDLVYFLITAVWMVPLLSFLVVWFSLSIIPLAIGRLLFCLGVLMLDGLDPMRDAWELTS